MANEPTRGDLLKWISGRKRAGEPFPEMYSILNDPHCPFDPDATSVEEINRMARALGEAGFVRVISPQGSHAVRVLIEEAGEQVVEMFDGSFAAYYAAQHGPTSFVTTFNAPVSGVVGVGHHVEQHQTNNFGIEDADRRKLDELIAAVRATTTRLAVGDSTRVGVYLDDIATEVGEPAPQASQVRSSADRLKGTARKIGDSALSAAVGSLVSFLAGLL